MHILKRRVTPRGGLAKVRRLLALSPRELSLLTLAFMSVALVDVGLRLYGFARVVQLIAGPSEQLAEPIDSDAFARAAQYARWIELAANHYVAPARCLHRSLTLHAWLRRGGLPSELRIGVRDNGGSLNAHAWVELDGKPANERPERIALFKPLQSPLGLVRDWRLIQSDGLVNDIPTRSQHNRKDLPWN